MTQFHPDRACIQLSPFVAVGEQVRQRAPEFRTAAGKRFILYRREEVDSPATVEKIGTLSDESGKHAHEGIANAS